MGKTILAMLAASMLFWGLAGGQTTSTTKNPTTILQTEPTAKAASVFLLDPSRFKIGHTISSSYASIGGHGVLTNMYLANIEYKLANPLDIRLSLGFANSQGALFGPKKSASAIIPGFELNYHPSNKFNLIINYQQYPAGY